LPTKIYSGCTLNILQDINLKTSFWSTIMPTRVLRLSHVLDRTGYSRSGLYARISAGLFPRPIALSTRASAWPEHEVETVLAAQIRTASDTQLQEIVIDLESKRASFGLAVAEAPAS
jgi:prophage regulatory protein